MSTDRISAKASAAIAHAVFRLGPATTSTVLGAVHAILNCEALGTPAIAAHLAAHRECFRLTGLGWVYIAHDMPPNPAHVDPQAQAKQRPRTRGEIMDALRAFGPTFRYAQALSLGLQSGQLNQLATEGHVIRTDRGSYRVLRTAPTAKVAR